MMDVKFEFKTSKWDKNGVSEAVCLFPTDFKKNQEKLS